MGAGGVSLHQVEIRITQYEPLRTGRLEVDFDACVRTLSFAIQDHTIAEFFVSHTLPEADAEIGGGRRRQR